MAGKDLGKTFHSEFFLPSLRRHHDSHHDDIGYFTSSVYFPNDKFQTNHLFPFPSVIGCRNTVPNTNSITTAKKVVNRPIVTKKVNLQPTVTESSAKRGLGKLKIGGSKEGKLSSSEKKKNHNY